MESEKKIKIFKGCGWGVLSLVLLFAIIAIIASPIARHIVNSRGEDIVGRQLHAGHVRVNLFTGGVTVTDFQCFEPNGTTNFFHLERLYFNIAYPRLLAKSVKIKHFHLDGFNGQVLQDKDRFNFSDIIEHFQQDSTGGKEWKVYVGDIRLTNSSVYYHDVQHKKEWQLENINLAVPGLDFANEDTNAGMDFVLPTGGTVKVDAGYHAPSNTIRMLLTMIDVNPDVLLPFVQDHMNISGIGGRMNGQLRLQARPDNIQNIAAQGSFTVHDIQIRDTYKTDVASLEEMRVTVNRIDLGNNTFVLDSLVLNGLTGSYEVHNNRTTLSRLLKTNGTEKDNKKKKQLRTKEQKKTSSKPINWVATTAVLTAHDLVYYDYSQKNNWSYTVKSLQAEGKNVSAIGRNTIKVNATLKNNAKLKGDFVGGMDVRKHNTVFNVTLSNVTLKDFDGLCRNYTGYPIEDGMLYAESHMEFKSGRVTGNTRLVIDNPNIGKREKFSKAPYKDLPVRSTFKSLVDSENRVVINAPLNADMNKKNYTFKSVFVKSLVKETFGHMMKTKSMKDKISEKEREEIKSLLDDDDDEADEPSSRGIRRISRNKKR